MQEDIRLTSILKDLYHVSGFRVSIHNTDYDEIYTYPKEALPFCGAIQQDPHIHKQCRDCDAKMLRKVEMSGKPLLYRCTKGLYEAAAPIYHYGVLAGFLMLGQVRDTDCQDLTPFLKVAEQVTDTKEEALKLVNQIPTVSKQLAHAYLNITTVIAEYLTQTNRIGTQDGKLAELVVQYLHKNYPHPIRLQEISQSFGYSIATLTKVFRAEYHCTIFEYLRDIRLKQAKQLLVDSKKSIKEIAHICGFADQNYFSRVFAEQNGCSPRDYRSSHT